MSGFWQAVLFLHLLAMATFVGGQVMLAGAIVPVERRDPDPPRMRLIARRFGVLSLGALAVLLVTGAAMATEFELWGSTTLQVKLGLVGLVIVLTGLHMRHPRRHALSALIFVATLAIVWLGIELGH